MSHPPDYPGRRRVKRAAASAANEAYQGAFEAVFAVLVGVGAGYWVDRRFGTTPYGVIVGVVIGFAAMVLRLLRMGRDLPPGPPGLSGGAGVDASGRPPGAPQGGPRTEVDRMDGADEDRGPAEALGLSDIWRDDTPDATDEQD